MDGTTDGDMLAEAEAAFKGVRGNPVAGARFAADVVERTLRTPHLEAHVVALHACALAEHEVLRNESALALLDRALLLAGRAGLVHRRGELLVSRAAVDQELGRLASAHRDLSRAAAALPAAQRPRLALQRAIVDHNAGRLHPAAARYQALLSDSRTGEEVRARAANNLADLELSRGRPGTALPWADLAVRLAPSVGPVVVAFATQTRARVLVQAGRPVEGLASFALARERYDAAGLAVGGHLLEYAEALADLRLLPEALATAREGAALLTGDDTSLMAAEAELRVARLELATGDTAAATTTATRAATRLRRQRRTAWVARALLVAQEAAQAPDPRVLRQVAGVLDRAALVPDAVTAHLAAGRAAASRGDRPAAARSLARASVRARRGPVLVRLAGRLAQAEAAVLRGEPPEGVLRPCRRGLADLARHRQGLPSAELRALASGHGVELARVGLRALLPHASPARVLGWLELMRAAAVGRATTEAAPDDGPARLRALHARLAEVSGGADARGREAPALLAQVAELEDSLRRGAWTTSGAVDAARRVGLGELRDLLQDRALVEYAELDGRLLAVVVAGRRPVRLVDLGPSEPVARLVSLLHFGLRRLAVPGLPEERTRLVLDPARAALDRLRDVLLGPLDLPPGTPLVVAPVGALQQVPWPALHAGPVAVAPSASVWARTATGAGRSRAGGVVLVAGPGLPGAQDEVARLRAVHPDARVLTGGAASAPEVLLALRGADLAHLSCHGTVRSDSPTFSSLQMGDGPLTLHEILTGAGAPARVVLAACDSAVEATYPGDEALGFVSALLGHGADAVLASTVLVPDLAAVPLMVAVHERLATGATVADALHAARATVDTGSATGFVASCAFTAFGAG